MRKCTRDTALLPTPRPPSPRPVAPACPPAVVLPGGALTPDQAWRLLGRSSGPFHLEPVRGQVMSRSRWRQPGLLLRGSFALIPCEHFTAAAASVSDRGPHRSWRRRWGRLAGCLGGGKELRPVRPTDRAAPGPVLPGLVLSTRSPALPGKSSQRLGGGRETTGASEWRKRRPEGREVGSAERLLPGALDSVPPTDRKGGFGAHGSTEFLGPGPSGPRYLSRRPGLSDSANKNTRFLPKPVWLRG